MERGGGRRTKGFLVSRIDQNEPSTMKELQSLAESAGYEVVGSLEQVGPPRPRYHIGSGKAEELAEIVSQLGAEKIIFGNDLKAVQVYNLAKLTKIEVIDRFLLILEIFVRRASTQEAKLQIDLARVRYELAHAREKVRLARIGEQPGFLGLGKYEVDVYYESVKRQVFTIQEKLKAIGKTRRLHRYHRQKLGLSTISLAGYTNSGKSTLFNALTEENASVGKGLFTTLSTTTRAIDFSEEKILLIDTVGFIDKLPLTLIEAFHSTLEETILSELILLVIDASEPEDEIERKLLCCLDTIREIGAIEIPIVTVLNKIDLLPAEILTKQIDCLKHHSLNIVPVSALKRTNLQTLKDEIARHLLRHVQLSFTTPINTESLSFLSWIYKHTDVHKVTYEKTSLNVSFSSSPQLADKIKGQVVKLGGTFINEGL